MAGKRKVGKKGTIFKIRTSRGVTNATRIKITDNSGAKIAMVIGTLGITTRLNRFPSATIGDIVVVTVKKGSPDIRKKIFKAVVVRQRMMVRRLDGTRVCFEDNAGVIVNDEGEPKGSVIRGPVAKEAAERFPKLASLASQIV
jgi:large subunit ribosomal protein L14